MKPQTFSFQLPLWINDFFLDDTLYPTVDDKMDMVIKASWKNIKEKTGGPFAAAIFEIDSGKIIALGVNLVATQGVSILHAEIVAITIAQRQLGTYDLGGHGMRDHELVTSTEPCAMCFGAIPWSGVRRVITGAKDEDARAIGFDEGPKLPAWSEALNDRGIEVINNIKRMEAKAVLDEYVKQGGQIYNSRDSKR